MFHWPSAVWNCRVLKGRCVIAIRSLVLAACLPLAVCATTIPIQWETGFETNQGQFRSDVLFGARPDAYVTATSLVLSPDQVTIQFEGANPNPTSNPSGQLPYVVNVFTGADPSKWITGIRQYGQVLFSGIYPGIDLLYLPRPFLTFRFVIRPGASPGAIRLSYSGATVIPFDIGPGLVINHSGPRMGQNSSAWQDPPSGRVSVGLHYTQLGSNRFGFTLDSYNPALPVTIESTLPLGAEGLRSPQFQARSGALYGFWAQRSLITQSPPAGTPGVVPDLCTLACSDVAITKFSASGIPIWLSYLRGTGEDVASSLDVDTRGNAYVTGYTNSPDFPVTPSAAQRSYAGPPRTETASYDGLRHGDVFLVKLDGATGAVAYSTFLGGPGDDSATAVHVDSDGNMYLGGPASGALPVSGGALQRTPCVTVQRPCVIGYAVKIDSSGWLAYLTYLPAAPTAFTVDAQGGLYFGGWAGGGDAFLAKLNSTGSALAYLSYYPASTIPAAAGLPFVADVTSIAIDSHGNAWFSGPSGGAPGQPIRPYLAKFNADATKLLYSAPFIGGGLAVDADNGLSVLTPSFPSKIVRTPAEERCSARLRFAL